MKAVTITRRGRPVGVIIEPETYERLRRVEAYLQMLKLSESLKESGLTASELFEASRAELEGRHDRDRCQRAPVRISAR